MHWYSTLFTEEPLPTALELALEQISKQNSGQAPDLLLVFVSGYSLKDVESIPAHLRKKFFQSLLLGCTAGGVLGDGREIEHRQALALTAAWLPEVKLVPFHLDSDSALELVTDSQAWQKSLGVSREAQPEFILLSDPFSFDPASFLKVLDESFPVSGKIGGLASGGRSPGNNRLILQDKCYESGLVGLAMTGNVAMDTLVAQGCRPIGNPMFITRGKGPALYELDGKPTLEVMSDLYQSLPPADQRLVNQSLFLGIAMRGQQQEYHAGDFLIRNLAGVLEEEGGLAVGAHVEEGMVVQFHLRDKATSAHDLEILCRRYLMAHGAEHQAPQGALLFSCLGRGIHLYGEPDHDSKLIQKFLGEIPIGGFFCNGEIGPVHHQTFLHGYTSSLGLFRPKHP